MTRFGVGWPWGTDRPAVMAQSIANTGCKEVRIPIPWADIERTQGVYDWQFLDSTVYVIRSKGLGVLPVVYRTPAWHRPNRADPPDPALYSKFLVEVAKRFSFPVYEIWNETNMPNLDWNGDAPTYARLYKTAREALHSFDPNKQAMVGGLAFPNGIDYLRSIWAQLGPVDCVAWHPYGLTVTATWDLLHGMVDFLNGMGSKAPVDVTEVGLPVGPGRPYTEKDRASYLKTTASKIKAWKRIRRWNVYTWTSKPETEWDIATSTGSWKGGASGYSAGIKG